MSHAPRYQTNLEFEVPGTVKLNDRLPPKEGSEHYQLKDIDMQIGYCTDPDTRERTGYFIEFSVYHQQDQTDRMFHANMNVHPTRDQMGRLRDFLDFLLRQPDE